MSVHAQATEVLSTKAADAASDSFDIGMSLYNVLAVSLHPAVDQGLQTWTDQQDSGDNNHVANAP